MSFHVPYSHDTCRVPNALIPGNETSDSPVEFDIAPAWGPDLARMKSLLYGSAGLETDGWSAQMQDAVIKSLETGGPAFVNTVLRIRNMTVPAQMAIRAGIQQAQQVGQSTDSPVPITTGEQFSRICGHTQLIGIALWVGMEIVKLSGKGKVDPRFFAQPSGSGGTGTPRPKDSGASGARRMSRRRATAGKGGPTTAVPTQPVGSTPGT